MNSQKSSLSITNPTVNTSGTISVNLSAILSSGTSTKVVYDQYGRILSGTNLSVSDIPNLSSVYVSTSSFHPASSSTSGYLTSSDWNTFNNKSEVSAVPTSSSIQTLVYLYSHPSINLKTNISASTPSATNLDLVQFPTYYIPNIIGFQFVGPSSGTYNATANIYTTVDGTNLILLTSGTINNGVNIDGALFLNTNQYSKFAADISISGTTQGVSVKVVS